MNQKKFTNIFLIVVIVAIIVAGGYFVFTKQSSVTQTHQPELPLSQDSLDNTSASFIGSWEVVSVQEESVQIVPERNGAVIDFFKDGTYKASGGCNEMMTISYKIQPGSKLSISAGGTKRKCAKDIVEFWDLNKVYRYEFADNVLFLHYKTESEVDGSFKLLRRTSN